MMGILHVGVAFLVEQITEGKCVGRVRALPSAANHSCPLPLGGGGAWLPPNLERSATTIAHAGSCTGREELPCMASRLWVAASSEPPHPSPIGNTAIKQMETGHYHCHNIKGRRAKDLQQKCIETRIKMVIRFSIDVVILNHCPPASVLE